MESFINEEKIFRTIAEAENPDSSRVDEILDKALELKGINLQEAAALLNITNKADLEKLFHTALQIKEEIYGKRLVLFAPLYISNYCANNCLYCGFRIDNNDIHRITLDYDEIRDETVNILEQGHKRVLLLMGENHKESPMDYFMKAIDAVYSARDSKGSYIRRINVEIAPLSDEEFQIFNKVPIGTYTVFQETYHRETYKRMHPQGKKSNYDWRLKVMDRALSNGMHDVGIGALFGLFDFRFETLALLEHANHLNETYNVGPHTISIPRLKYARNAPAAQNIEHGVSDEDFKKLVATLRLAVPYTGMILSTREPAYLREDLFNLGISQISAGSKTNPGGYKQAFLRDEDNGQFNLNDCRSCGEVIHDVIERGFIPSFCTACYRKGRIGEDFMDLAKPGLIKIHCQPNALMTLKEYLLDYASPETQKIGFQLIEKELAKLPNENIIQKTRKSLDDIKQGTRDIYF